MALKASCGPVEPSHQANSALWALWRRTKESDRLGPYVPAQYSPIPPSSLIFVGLNPSFSKSGWRRLISVAKRESVVDRAFDYETFFRWSDAKDFDSAICLSLERLARLHYPFYRHHATIARAAGFDGRWEHIDLLACRNKDQKFITSSILVGDSRLSRFAEAQLAISERLLDECSPAVVVFVNALAARIFRKRQKGLQWDSALGCYVLRNQDTDRVTLFFFGGMPKYMDEFSRSRLCWNVAHAVGRAWYP